MRPTQISEADSLAIIEEEARAVAVSFGIGPSAEMAAAVVDRIVLRLGGGYVYIRGNKAKEREALHTKIRAMFTGDNLEQLARELNMSQRHLRRIVAKRVSESLS